MDADYKAVANLIDEITPPTDGTLSRTLLQNDHLKAVLFGFAAGQELSEHTAATPAILHFLSGEADVTLGAETLSAAPGAWIHMPPNLPHSIRAKTPVTMLLLLLKPGTKGLSSPATTG
jgi:quercetin dioxygenase-like cupin family protein